MAHLVTGYAGQAHIKSADEGAFNASFFGGGQYITELGNQFEGSIIDNNTVRITDGDGLMYGRHFRIEPNSYEDLTITTGTAGKNRIDLICMTYEKNPDDETERCYLQVIKGTEADGTPSVPEYTNGNILEGASFNQMPLYKVIIEGVVLSKIERLFATIPPFEFVAESFSNPNLLVNGDFQVWQRGESFVNTWDMYTVDRWKLMHVNAKTTTVEKSTDVPPNTSFVSSVKIVDTTKENARFRQYIENHLKAGVTYTLSFYAKFENDFMIRTLVVDGGTQNSLNMKAHNEWKKYVWTFTCNSEVIGIEMLTNFVGTVYFTGIKLELGEIATPYIVPLYGDELIRCGSPDDSSTYGYKAGGLSKSDVVDNLLSERSDLPLSARMGNELNKNMGGLRFGKDGDGNYGYYGADDSLIPFKKIAPMTFKKTETNATSDTTYYSESYYFDVENFTTMRIYVQCHQSYPFALTVLGIDSNNKSTTLASKAWNNSGLSEQTFDISKYKTINVYNNHYSDRRSNKTYEIVFS